MLKLHGLLLPVCTSRLALRTWLRLEVHARAMKLFLCKCDREGRFHFKHSVITMGVVATASTLLELNQHFYAYSLYHLLPYGTLETQSNK